jgi:hypothetical protein
MLELRQRQPRITNERHLALIRTLPCLICFRAAPSEAAHIRYGDPARGKLKAGVGEKPDDKWTLPLCAEHHRTGPDAQHAMGERQWWELHGIDPISICQQLYGCQSERSIEELFFTICFGRSELLW